MNSGHIAIRYAKAFLQLVEESGHSEETFRQTGLLMQQLHVTPGFRQTLSDEDSVTVEQKVALLKAAVQPYELCPEFVSLITLMSQNRRSEFFRLVLIDFVESYRLNHKIAVVQVTSAIKDDEAVNAKIGGLIKNLKGFSAFILNKVDPDLIGGFIIETWWWRVDASVKGALEKTRKQLTYRYKKNI